MLIFFSLLFALEGSTQVILKPDTLNIKPEEPRWGDTLNITLTPAKERGDIVLYYKAFYPEGEWDEGWTHLQNDRGIYRTSIPIDTNTVFIWFFVRGEYYLKATCPFIPRKKIIVYAPDGRPAEEFLGDTLTRTAQRWNHAFWKRDSGEVFSEVKAFIKGLESKKSHTLTESYALAASYLIFGDIDKSFKLVEKMFEINPSSALIPDILRNFSYQLYKQRRLSKAEEEKIDSLELMFMEKNPEKRITWEMAYWREFCNIPDSLTLKILDKWIPREPKNPIPLFYLASLFEKRGKPEEALKRIEKAIELMKKGFLIIYGASSSLVSMYGARFYRLRGELYEKKGNLDKAVESFEEALKMATTTEEKIPEYLALGKILLKKNRLGRAEDYYLEAFLNGDTTESEKQLKNLYKKRKSKGMTFEKYLRRLNKKTKIPRSKAPDFETFDFSGKKATLSDRKGKFLVIDFWQMGCPASVAEIPSLNKLFDEFKDKGIDFWAIGFATEEFLEKKPFNWRILSLNIDIAQKYSITAYPQHLIIDPDGFIRYHKLGSEGTYKKLKRVLERLLLVWER